MKPMRALTVDFDLITQSMRDLCRETADYYLDKVSGKVVSLSRDLSRALTRDRGDEKEEIPAWDARMVPMAREIILTGSPNYVRIPEAFGCPEHKWMIAFAETVTAPKLKEKILPALRGRGSCRRFKEIIQAHPEESKRWLEFRSQCWRERIEQWLGSLGVIAIEEKPPRFKTAA
ncbi:MAG: UPF0158 family protein [Elusimicrobia bacterium]|nr:UPF0158 family protein [Candidatus Obscuribacterium magneticum]